MINSEESQQTTQVPRSTRGSALMRRRYRKTRRMAADEGVLHQARQRTW